MRALAKFLVHVGAAMPGAVILGVMLCGLESSGGKNPWFDVPYSPFLWGTALVLGFALTRLLGDKTGLWVWMVGISWFVLFTVSELRFYSPQLCDGCTRAQYFWDTYFSYRDMTGEGLGLFFATAPMLTSLAYSVGAAAAVALLLGRTARSSQQR
jgi:hypothetical protein